ncbi:MAG: hypothetical protein IPI60_06610 [Saprospiraceae bacterium]|nr:hypothetical protein [Saprospiraceae bacterium]
MQKINSLLPFYFFIIGLLLYSGCKNRMICPLHELAFPATYELKSVEITDGSYKINAEGEPVQISHDSFFNLFAAPEYMQAELLNLLRDSLRFATEIDIRSNTELTLRGISLGLDEESIDLIYRYKGDSLTLRTNTGPISLVIHHEKTDSTFICI